ncbi:MAG: RSP_2647 family RNA methyltransferase [Halocynthiibacter sp.]
MMTSSLPTLRLHPKTEKTHTARAIRHGFPWVYSNELVLDRRSKKVAAGSIARLEDSKSQFLAYVAVNMTSRITGRVLSVKEDATFGDVWIKDKITTAAAHRDRLYDAPFYRLLHAESDGLPGVVIDRFGDVAVVQPNAAWADARMDDIAAGLQNIGVKTVIMNGSGRARVLEGLAEETTIFQGDAPDGPLQVPMNGATYMADVLGGQKTGLFYDQRPNHAFAAGLSKGARVLDVFSHVGGFSLAALAGGATSALAVDGSQAALDLATKGADAMGMSAAFSTRKGDAFDVLAQLQDEGAEFDVVICDPPAFAPNKKALDAGLRAYERVARLAAPLVAKGGYLGLCSCSHAADLSKFRNSSARGIGRGGRKGQIIYTGFAGPDHPVLPQLAESGYLKSLFFRLD